MTSGALTRVATPPGDAFHTSTSCLSQFKISRVAHVLTGVFGSSSWRLQCHSSVFHILFPKTISNFIDQESQVHNLGHVTFVVVVRGPLSTFVSSLMGLGKFKHVSHGFANLLWRRGRIQTCTTSSVCEGVLFFFVEERGCFVGTPNLFVPRALSRWEGARQCLISRTAPTQPINPCFSMQGCDGSMSESLSTQRMTSFEETQI